VIGVIHAYSRTNAGDGLLVDLTLERLKRVGADRDEVVLVALDPESFPEIPRRVAMGTRTRGISRELTPAAARAAGLAASAISSRELGEGARALAGCGALVAVGGGYLRSVDLTSSAGTMLNHVPQLLAAGRASVPSIYLPQSIGPLRGPVGRAVVNGLRRVDAVCVRDAWSEADLADLPNVRRIPDLAVLDVAERWEAIDTVGSDGSVGIVARQVTHAPGYEDHLRDLTRRLGDRAVWAVQTAGDPTKSDGVHYERLGIEAGGRLSEMLDQRQLSVVVSVRLHGALMALEAGVPAIHLAYDRKGPAAFADLGLGDWCFDVRSLDPADLGAAVDRLLDDPQPYWDEVAKMVPTLQVASGDLDDLVARTVDARN
jgi:polysaccharide pyruvyl transferase WcaK-like protein